LRTSATASLSPINLDLALIALNSTMALAAQSSDDKGEFLSVLRYAPGQEYRPHIDCIPRGKDFDASGQRVKTALLFLNDDYRGGETHFLAPDIRIKGQRGDILVFSNVLADGEPDKAARHAGLPVTAGEKWLASRWFRSKKFKF
jgi:prolyl 4-hydroxylase